MRSNLALPSACFLVHSPHRVLALPPAYTRLLHSDLLRTIAIQRLLASCAQQLLSNFSTVPPPLGESGEKSLRPTLLPADSCHTAGIEEMGLHRSRQSVVVCNRLPRIETAASLTTAVDPLRDSRLSRALGPPGDQADDWLGRVSRSSDEARLIHAGRHPPVT
jgi:hypothetical protein